MNAVAQMAFESELLDKDYHMELIKDIDRVVARAGIPREMIWTSMKGICSQDEIEWAMAYSKNRLKGVGGLVYTGKMEGSIEDRMMAMTAAFLRNYIDARMMTLQEVLDATSDKAMPDPSVLLIPNFFISKGSGGQIASWKINDLLGMLISRRAQNKMTILYVQSIADLKKEYGEPMAKHLSPSHYSSYSDE